VIKKGLGLDGDGVYESGYYNLYAKKAGAALFRVESLWREHHMISCGSTYKKPEAIVYIIAEGNPGGGKASLEYDRIVSSMEVCFESQKENANPNPNPNPTRPEARLESKEEESSSLNVRVNALKKRVEPMRMELSRKEAMKAELLRFLRLGLGLGLAPA